MCKAMEDMRDEAEERGKAIGEAIGEANGEARGKILGALDILKEAGLSDDEIIKKVAEKYSVTEDYVRSLMHPAA